MPTLQEAYDKIKERARDKRKATNDGACVYRHPSDATLRCFVGVLISDLDYRTQLEGHKLTDDEMSSLPSLKGLTRAFLEDMQSIHDGSSPDRWMDKLQRTARIFGLKP